MSEMLESVSSFPDTELNELGNVESCPSFKVLNN